MYGHKSDDCIQGAFSFTLAKDAWLSRALHLQYMKTAVQPASVCASAMAAPTIGFEQIH